jgi:hypothetical protein
MKTLTCALALCCLAVAAFAQTAPMQVEKYYGPSIGRQWDDILANHPRTSGTAPALSSCGTAPSNTGSTDTAGRVVMGTGTPTGCVITFATPYVVAPHCVVTWQAELASMEYVTTATAITITQTATDSNVINYICIARAGG